MPKENLETKKTEVGKITSPHIEREGEAPEYTTEELMEMAQEEDSVIILEDFSYIAKDGKRIRMTLKEKLFCDLYLQYRGDRVDAIIDAGYDINYKDKTGQDTGVPNRKLASVMAYEKLVKPNITSYLTAKYREYGYDDENVDLQHTFLINQNADLKVKAKAIDMFKKSRGDYPRDNRGGNLTVNVFSLADLADKSKKREQMGLPPIKVLKAVGVKTIKSPVVIEEATT